MHLSSSQPLVIGIVADNSACIRLIHKLIPNSEHYTFVNATRFWEHPEWDYGSTWHVALLDCQDTALRDKLANEIQPDKLITLNSTADTSPIIVDTKNEIISLRRPELSNDPASLNRFKQTLLSGLRRFRNHMLGIGTGTIEKSTLTKRFSRSSTKQTSVNTHPTDKNQQTTKRKRSPFDICVIGSSTGGPDALKTIFSSLTQPPDIPIVITQHIPSGFAEGLALQLSREAPCEVSVLTHNTKLYQSNIYLAPDGKHTELSEDVLYGAILTDDPPVNSCKPSVDPLFDSAAKIYHKRCLAIILTGMGNDGLEGCKKIHQAGGTIIAQDEESSVVWGMPGAVITANLADIILPLNDIGSHIEALIAGEQHNGR